MSKQIGRHLSRLWRTVPLPRLKQGTTLSIRSRVPSHVLIQPEWRDDGLVELKQVFDKAAEDEHEVELTVVHEEDQTTSLGRVESHVSLLLEPSSSSSTRPPPPPPSDVIHHSTSKTIDSIMLDDGTILPDSPQFAAPHAGQRRIEYHDGIAHISKLQGVNEPPGTFIEVSVPEKLNFVCDLEQGGSISISSKLEGDAKLSTSNGDILVTKLRGHVLELSTGSPGNSIYATELMEAQRLNITTKGRVRAKQIHGRYVEINVEPDPVDGALSNVVLEDADDEGSLVDLSSLFVSGGGGATIKVSPCHPARRAVRVKSHHGALQVLVDGLSSPKEMNEFSGATYPLIELGGVNGSCEVTTSNTQASNSSENWTSCLVHFDSLAPDSVTLLSVDVGNTSITLDRKIESDLRLLSTSSSECLVETGALLAEEEDGAMVKSVLKELPGGESASTGERISIETDAFTPKEHCIETEDVEYVDGWVENKSNEPGSRFERKMQGSADLASVGGKIRLDGAADQALRGFAPQGEENEPPAHGARPLIAAVTTGRIVVETVSWLGAIARRYGLEESGRDLGRTASRKGRPIEPRNE